MASAVVLGDGRTPDLPAIRGRAGAPAGGPGDAPFILLRPGLDARLDAAQRAAAADPRVQAAARSAAGDHLLAR